MFSARGKLYMSAHKTRKSLPSLFTPLLSSFLSSPRCPQHNQELWAACVTQGRTSLAGTDPRWCWAAAPTWGTDLPEASPAVQQWAKRAAGLGAAPDPGSILSYWAPCTSGKQQMSWETSRLYSSPLHTEKLFSSDFRLRYKWLQVTRHIMQTIKLKADHVQIVCQISHLMDWPH